MSYSLAGNIPEEGTVHSPVLAPLSVTQRREKGSPLARRCVTEREGLELDYDCAQLTFKADLHTIIRSFF